MPWQPLQQCQCSLAHGVDIEQTVAGEAGEGEGGPSPNHNPRDFPLPLTITMALSQPPIPEPTQNIARRPVRYHRKQRPTALLTPAIAAEARQRPSGRVLRISSAVPSVGNSGRRRHRRRRRQLPVSFPFPMVVMVMIPAGRNSVANPTVPLLCRQNRGRRKRRQRKATPMVRSESGRKP